MNRRMIVCMGGLAVLLAFGVVWLVGSRHSPVEQREDKAPRQTYIKSVEPKLPRTVPAREKKDVEMPKKDVEKPESAQAPVFSINGKSFRSLQEAVDAAQEGDTVTLMADAYVRNPVSVRKSLRFDLNGFRMTARNSALSGGRSSRKGIRSAGAHAITVVGDHEVVIENGAIDVLSNGGWEGFTGAVETVPDPDAPARPPTEAAEVPNDDANFDVVLRDLEITSDAMRDGAFRNAEGKMLIDGCTVSSAGGNGSYTLGEGSETTIRDSRFDTTGMEGEYSYWNNTVAVAYDGKATVESGTYVTHMAEGVEGTTYGTFVYSSGGTIDIRGGEFQADHVAEVTKDMASYGETYGVSEIVVKDGALAGKMETHATGEGAEDAAGVSLYGGVFDTAPKPEQVPDGHEVVDYGDGTYSVEAQVRK